MRRARGPLLALLLLAAATAAAPRPCAAAAAAGSAAPASPLDWASTGWSPAGPWRTLAVPGYRIHYPAPAEAWARHLAARLPAIRARVAAAAGFAPAQVVDVVLADPIAQPNGATLPLLDAPRLVLLLTPPTAASQLGDFPDWPTLLVTHEQAHLAHLLRPSRSPLWKALGLPLGPVALGAPRWAVEGYATLLEGRLTGSGRPTGALRAAVLRRLAQRGQLPGYGALSGTRGWLGGSLAYLGGSAFLDWLEHREGEGSLDKVWRRLSARRSRSFDEAFRGVYGESPTALWGVFGAELTWKAVEVEHRLASALRAGEPWLDRDDATGAPALSRDGARLVLALAGKRAPLRLAVYAAADDPAALAKQEEADRRLLARDPEDVAAVRRGAPPRRALATLELPGTTVSPLPRFLPDGSVLFARSLPDAQGTARADLFRWWPDGARVDRVTRHADLRAADPAPDGTWAAAVQSRWGATRLVRVDLRDGALTPLSPASVETLVDAPRVAPDGRRLAYLRHAEGAARWELVVRDLASGAERVVPAPDGALFDPAWAPAGDALYAVVGEGGLLDVQRLPLDGTAPRQITRTPGAATAPAPTPDGKALFFLSLEPEGLPVRRLALPAEPPLAGADLAALDAGGPEPARAALAPALPPLPPPPPAPLALVEVPAARPYGAGRPEWTLASGGTATAGSGSLELGARGGDVLGRWDLLALGALGSGAGAEGGAVAAAWRGFPVELGVHAFAAREALAPGSDAARGALAGTDLDQRGLELSAGAHRAWLDGGMALRAAASAGTRRAEPRGETSSASDAALAGAGAGDESTRMLLLAGSAGQTLRRGSASLGGRLDVTLASARTGGDGWSLHGGRLGLDLGLGDLELALGAERQDEAGTPHAGDLLAVGGLPSTLLPDTALANRVLEPGLPAGALAGDAHEAQRVALTLPGLPLQPFWARHRVARAGAWSDWLALAGLEWELALPPLSIVRLPATHLQLGAAYGLDAPYRDDVRFWVAFTLRP